MKRLLAVADGEQGKAAVEQNLRARGLSSQVTDAGPPEKMIPLGPRRSNASSAALKGEISQ
jgi:hypothetical protein